MGNRQQVDDKWRRRQRFGGDHVNGLVTSSLETFELRFYCSCSYGPSPGTVLELVAFDDHIRVRKEICSHNLHTYLLYLLPHCPNKTNTSLEQRQIILRDISCQWQHICCCQGVLVGVAVVVSVIVIAITIVVTGCHCCRHWQWQRCLSLLSPLCRHHCHRRGFTYKPYLT